jgi:hypothetical protein
MSVELAHAKE